MWPAGPRKLLDFGELVLSATGPGVWPRLFSEHLQKQRAWLAIHSPISSAGDPTARLGTETAGDTYCVPA